MAIGETAELAVHLKLKDDLSGPLGRASGSLNQLNRQTATVSGGVSKMTQGLGVGIRNITKIGLLAGGAILAAGAAALKSGIDSLNELQAVEAQTAAAIKSTGQASGITAKQIRDQANALEDLTTIDDKTIQRSENLLLTFTNIKNVVGANNDIFNQATKATLDMSTALGTDVKQSAIQLGKALNDPVKGITALTRVGVAFTAEQKKQITDLVKHNNLLGAQKIILKEINKEFGGSAAAQAGTYAGQVRRLADAWEDLKIAGARAALPGLTSIAKALADALKSPEAIQGAQNLGKALTNVLSPENLRSAIQFAREVLPGIAAGLRLAGTAAQAIFKVWSGLPKELQAIAVTALIGNKLTGGLVTSGIGDIAKAIGGKTLGGLFQRGGSPATPMFVADVTGGGGALGKVGGLTLGGIVGAAAGGLGIAAAFKILVQDPVFDAATKKVVQDAQRQIASKPGAKTLTDALHAIQQGERDIKSLPGGEQLYAGQLKAFQELEKLYRAAIAEVTIKGPAATQKQKDAPRNQRDTLKPLDLKRAVTEGNRGLPQRRDLDSTGLRITGAIRQMQGGIRSVEQAGFAAVVTAVWAVQAAVRGLPANFGSAAQQGRGTGPGSAGGGSAGRPGVQREPRVGIEKNRDRNLNVFHVNVSTSARQNDQGQTIQHRYGPTPATAGAS